MIKSEHIVITRAGGPEVMHLQSFTLAPPAETEVRVRIEAAGVAFADVMMREGRYPSVKLPTTPGYDCVGHVEQVGARVTDLQIGQRVAALTVVGSYARHINIPSAWAAPIPESVPKDQAVALILNYVTAYQMMFRNTALASGDWALVHGGGGGVGTALLDLCRHRGINTFATASVRKHPLVASYGAIPIDYDNEDFVQVIQAECPRGGADAVFDHLGGGHLKRSYAALCPTGVLVSYGALAAFSNGRASILKGVKLLTNQPKFSPLDLLGQNKAVVGFDIAGRRLARPDWFATDVSALMTLWETGKVRPVIDDVLPLKSAQEAHERLGKGQVMGKIVLDCE